MSDRPIHVRVAEKLGWTDFAQEYPAQYGWTGKPPGVSMRVAVPQADVRWDITGPLIERHRIFLGPSYEPGGANRWHACLTSGESCLFGDDSHGPNAAGDTPLLAVCHLILMLPDEAVKKAA